MQDAEDLDPPAEVFTHLQLSRTDKHIYSISIVNTATKYATELYRMISEIVS